MKNTPEACASGVFFRVLAGRIEQLAARGWKPLPRPRDPLDRGPVSPPSAARPTQVPPPACRSR
ncbi:hypothetical protein PPH41_25705, partial [Burkholderia gladioli]|nr:hypothetical protein [Burkholderia gladioli]